MCVEVDLAVERVDLRGWREAFREAGLCRIERELRGAHEVREQRARILVADRDAGRGRRDAGSGERFGRKLRVAGQRGTEHDGVHLAERDLQAERGLEAVEEALERGERDLRLDREQRRGETEVEPLFA